MDGPHFAFVIRFPHMLRQLGQFREVCAPWWQTLGIQLEVSIVSMGIVCQLPSKLVKAWRLEWSIPTLVISRVGNKYRKPDPPDAGLSKVFLASHVCKLLGRVLKLFPGESKLTFGYLSIPPRTPFLIGKGHHVACDHHSNGGFKIY